MKLLLTLTINVYNTLYITTNNLHYSTFPSFSLSVFTEEDVTNINNEDRKEFKIRKKC